MVWDVMTRMLLTLDLPRKSCLVRSTAGSPATLLYILRGPAKHFLFNILLAHAPSHSFANDLQPVALANCLLNRRPHRIATPHRKPAMC